MKIYESIGRIKSDKAHLVSFIFRRSFIYFVSLGVNIVAILIDQLGVSATGDDTESEDVANAIITAARSLQYSEDDISSMISIYSGCGYQIYA